MSNTTIEWSEKVWNVTTGCSKVSAGCRNCYAERHSKRLQKNPLFDKYRNGFDPTFHDYVLDYPNHWRKPRLVFVNSMSDLFHEEFSNEQIKRVFEVIANRSQHQFQILTKRSERLVEANNWLEWPDNAWVGVSVENDSVTYRIDHLRQCNAKVKWLSIEPLIGPINNLDLTVIDWVVVGGESGPHSRPIDKQWVRDIRDNCIAHSVPFFFKQWGGRNKKQAGRLLDGRTWDEFPK